MIEEGVLNYRGWGLQEVRSSGGTTHSDYTIQKLWCIEDVVVKSV